MGAAQPGDVGDDGAERRRGGESGLRARRASARRRLRRCASALGTLAASARVYGTDGYSETRIVGGLARDLPLSTTRRLAVGLAAGYDAVSIDGFGSTGSVHLAVGIQGDVVPTVRAGLRAP